MNQNASVNLAESESAAEINTTKSKNVIQQKPDRLKKVGESSMVVNNHTSIYSYDQYLSAQQIPSSITPTNYAIVSAPTTPSLHNHFIDNDFPHNRSSLFDANKKSSLFRSILHSRGLDKTKKWLRPAQIKVESNELYLPITLFSNPNPYDVLQGGVGSCWFIAALAALAEHINLVYSLISPTYYNQYGLHQVKLCRRGQWVLINIDDYLPVTRNNSLVFGYSKSRQMWVSFVEKALAKLYGSYEAIASGACVEGMQTLTGRPCQVIYLAGPRKNFDNPNLNLDDKDNPFGVWQQIIEARRAGNLMTALCYNKDIKIYEFLRAGLVGRHVYTVLDIREYMPPIGTTNTYRNDMIRLIKLRNPWGRKEFRGPWSKDWPLWPDNMRNQGSNIKIPDDGCFWISYKEFIKYFYDITICKSNKLWFDSRQSSYFYEQAKFAHIYTFTLPQNASKKNSFNFDIELFATGRKKNLFDRNSDPEVDLCLMLLKTDDLATFSNLTCISFEHSVEYFISLSSNLQPGTYIIFVMSFKGLRNVSNDEEMLKNDTNSINYYTYNLVAHCDHQFQLTQSIANANLIADFFYAAAIKANKIKYDLDSNMRVLVLSGSSNHGLFIENLSFDSTIQVELDSSSAKNVDQSRISTKLVDYLPPRTRQLITYIYPHNFNKGYLIGYKLNSTLLKSNYACENNPKILSVYAGIHAIRQI